MMFWTGAGTLPALAVGGALAEIDERLLEIPLVCVGLAWMRVGWTCGSVVIVHTVGAVASTRPEPRGHHRPYL